MRIGIDGIPLATPKTGIGHYTFEVARELARSRPADEFELIAPVPIAARPGGAEGGPGVAPANLRACVPRTDGSLRRRWWSFGLPLHLREQNFTLYHGTNYNVPPWADCPTVVTVHDLSLLLHPETHEARLVELARRRLPVMTRTAAHVLTDSESVRAEICDLLGVEPERVTAVPLAARRAFCPAAPGEAEEVRRRLGVREDFVLFVGTVEPRKNLLTLVRAFDLLARASTLRPQLVIAGRKGWLTEELYELVERSPSASRILFTGYVTDEELCALYSSCRVFAYPSLYEGFGLPPLEAMACGAPVVASRIPVIEETAGAEAARLVAPTDAEALAAALAELLRDDAARSELAARGLARAAEFTWERTARQTFEVYERVLAEHRPRRRAATA
ncbi:MAG TPA: glycosyltransferase family 1 protein [Pyrinomonadaceae bacterium]|nr:glycosyltransferase family 1 protein [Pyrinomonadaceae bacterium]